MNMNIFDGLYGLRLVWVKEKCDLVGHLELLEGLDSGQRLL